MLFSDQEALTQYGYFKVGDVKTFSKHEAFLHAKHDWSKVQYIYNDDVFSQYDWTQEPTEDLYALFDERAKQLRSQYDYVVIFYSSGSDSQTILDTFLRNNLRVDELCTLYVEGPKKSFVNDEVFRTVIPNAQHLNIKLRLINTSFDILNYDHDNIEFHNNISLSQFYIVRDSFVIKQKLLREYKHITDKGKKVCLIWGFEKPTIDYNSLNKQYVFRGFFDSTSNHALSQMLYQDPIVDEDFFWSRYAPKIAIKHCHQIKNILLKIPSDSLALCSFEDLPNGGPYYEHSEGKYLKYDLAIKAAYPKLIYNSKLDSKFMFPKTVGRIFTNADKWVLESNHESQSKFYNKIKYMATNYLKYFTLNSNNGLYSIKPVFSKSYAIHNF